MENEIITPITIINEDGTSMDDYPKNPLYEKWDREYPPTRHGKPCCGTYITWKDGSKSPNYTCVLCHEKCRHNDSWECPEEDLPEYIEYMKKVKEYDELHNPSMVKYVDISIQKLMERLENSNGGNSVQ